MTPTESKSIEDYFRQKRLAYLPDAVSLTTIFGEFVAVNDAFCRATGYGREIIIGKTGAHWICGSTTVNVRNTLKSLES